MPTPDEIALFQRIASLTLAQRQASDPMRHFQPTVKQRPFADSVLHPEISGKWENWAVGSNRWGKTAINSWCTAKLLREGIEPIHSAYSTLPDGTSLEVRDRATSGWIFGLDGNVIRDVLQPALFDNGHTKPGQPEPFIPAREIAEWRPGDQELRLKSGSVAVYKSCEALASKSAGAGLDFISFDEPPPKKHYEEATIRVGAGRRLRVFATATLLPPEGHVETISWVYSEIIAPILEGRKTDVGLFNASIYDNPFISGEEIARLEARYPLGSLARRIRLNGELIPGISGAVAYGNFARAIHVREQPPLSPYKPLCWCWDFNVSPFCTVLGQRDGNLFRVYDEIVLDEGVIEDQVDAFRQRYPRHPHEIWIYGDANGGNRSHLTQDAPKSSYTMLLKLMQAYSARLRMKVPAANPLEVDRVNAMNLALRDETGATHVIVSPQCQELITDLEQVLADPRGGLKKTYNQKDPYSRRTHTSDCLSYWVTAEAPVKAMRPQGTAPVQVKAAGYGVAR